ncbi:MAG: chitobiase/beta-hexosaminidase C-terminal domain-containing protein [Lachnospiraceae bacterium]|nr:chitobiase/beta-hexosaminidase C-terminal domain-containing protein [Lachnospiraceae bacterium]
MKCPKCGKEIPEGKLICESCGTEIRMVPDYVPIPEEPDVSATEETDISAPEREDADSVTSKLNRQMLLLLIPVVIITLLLVFVSGRVYHAHSVKWQYKQAQKALTKESYADARSYLERCYVISGGDAKYLLEIASTYEQEQDIPHYRLELENLSYSYNVPEDVRNRAMEALCDSYASTNEYQRLADYIAAVDSDHLRDAYGDYLAPVPEFSSPSGSYDETFRVELNSPKEGTIYYTIDGSFPTTHSMRYEKPLELDEGKTVVSAIFVNAYGVSSDVKRETYEIVYSVPEDPVINLQSGVYNERRSIVVTCEEGCSVYYTIGGADPNETCRKYTEPIKLPEGVSIFKFIAINDVTFAESNIISRTYDFELAAYEN